MLQEICTKYKERLVNINGRNRSLVMKRLYKKSAFDIYRLNRITPGFDREMVDFLASRRKDKIQMLDDPYKWQEKRIKEAEKIIARELQQQLQALPTDQYTKEKLREMQEQIKQKFAERKIKENERITKNQEEVLSDSQSLTYLLREIQATEKETGRYELFIGYPFVEGFFKDKTFVKAPLLMYPVRISKNGDAWYLENIKEQNVMLNKVFLMAIAKYNEVNIGSFQEEFEDNELDSLQLNSVAGIADYLAQYNITIQVENDTAVEKFGEHTKDTSIYYSPGELKIKPYLVLGQFPVANSIYNDYLQLEKQEIEHEQLEKLLLNTDEGGAHEGCDQEPLAHRDLSEEELYLLTPLDYSQERAVKASNTTSKLVIYGPPGTGKSQTIANIISDHLAKGKNILMVSQKKAALDVIYNRLANISSKVVLIHDINIGKKPFYNKVAAELEGNSTGAQNPKHTGIREKNVMIDQAIRCLNLLGEKLTLSRSNGLTLQEMYAKTKKIANRDDQRYQNFKAIRNCSFLADYPYCEIEYAVQDIFNKNVIEQYKTYKQYLHDHAFILKIKDGLDCFVIEDYVDKINNLFDKYQNSIRWPFTHQDEYAAKVLAAYKQSNYKISAEQILSLSEQTTHQRHGELLQKLNNGQWWNLSYWLNYSKNKQQEQLNRQQYEHFSGEISQSFTQYHHKIQEVLNDINFVQNAFDIEQQQYYSILFEQHDLTEYIEQLKASLMIYEQYQNVVASLNHLTKLQLEILAYAYEQSSGSKEIVNVLQQIPEFSILFHIGMIEQDEREILIRYKDFESLTAEVNRLIAKKQEIIPEYIIGAWNNRLVAHQTSNQKQIKELTRQANKKKMLWPIRRCMEEFDQILLDLFPCWLLSPETVSEILPIHAGMFDMIIFDEASQMFVENAIPAIYRGKSVVIAGDDKQLRPSSSFRVKIDSDEESDDIEMAAALEEESLLDLAKVNYQSTHLCYHYRALYDELINFSNYGFYGGRLEVSPNIIRNGTAHIKPIERIMVDGRWIDRKNRVEAEKVVEIIADLLKNRSGNETIGVITFNITQKDLIDDMLDAKAKQDLTFRELYAAEKQRLKENEDVSLFVKNIENVQGDERDIIIFSTGYAKNEKNRLSINFGSLSQDGGENRLNVAISRAKKKIYVVTSFEPEELDVENTKNNGPKLFKKYLQYVREISAGNQEGVTTLLNSLLDSEVGRNTANYFDSGFEEEVYDQLTARGYIVDTQVGVSGYRIDMAIYDPQRSKYILGIECDGAAYHSSKSARERDIFRQKYLESRGWKILRIWSRDWWENSTGEIDKIAAVIQQQMN